MIDADTIKKTISTSLKELAKEQNTPANSVQISITPEAQKLKYRLLKNYTGVRDVHFRKDVLRKAIDIFGVEEMVRLMITDSLKRVCEKNSIPYNDCVLIIGSTDAVNATPQLYLYNKKTFTKTVDFAEMFDVNQLMKHV